MKKQYTKPVITIDRFLINERISESCNSGEGGGHGHSMGNQCKCVSHGPDNPQFGD